MAGECPTPLTTPLAGWTDALRFQESATSLIGPDGDLVAHVPYGREQLLVHDVDLSRATGLCARRYNPAFYPPDEEGRAGAA